MEAKETSEYNVPGYSYKNQSDRYKDFDTAEDYFKENAVSSKSAKLSKRSNTTHHSFIHYRLNVITVAIAYGKIDNRLNSGLIGNGTYGRVKFAIDREGKPYALKVLTFLGNGTKAEQIERIKKEVRIATKCGLIIAEVKHGKKSYSLQRYMGQNLRTVFQENRLSTPSIKYNIARKLCYLLFKLHDQHEVTHGDIKDENITLSETGDVNFIDYGFSDDMNNNAARNNFGTLLYHPHPIQKKETHNNNDPSSQRYMHSLRLTRTNHDLFALIRVLYMVDYAPEESQKDKHIGIFNPLEYQDLPEFLKDILNTDNDHLSHVVERIAQQKYESEIAFMLAIYFMALEFEINIAIETLTIEQQHEICVCVTYLDKLKEMDQVEFAAFKDRFKHILSNHHIEAELPTFRSQIEGQIGKIDGDIAPFRPKQATLPSKRNQALSKNCAFLEKNNLLTSGNFNRLSTPAFLSRDLLKLLTLLDEHNVILTQETFDLIQDREKTDLLCDIFQRIPKGLVHTQEDFKLVVNYSIKKLGYIKTIISLCSEEYVKPMIIHPQLETLHKILFLLPNSFVHENFRALLDHKALSLLHAILLHLADIVFFNKEREQVVHHPNIPILYEILTVVPKKFIRESLQSILTCQKQKELGIFLNILSTTSSELTLERLTTVIKHKDIEALNFSLLFLNKTNMFTEENLTSVLSHSDLKSLNNILWLVMDEPLFVQAEFEFIVKHDKPSDLYLFLNLLVVIDIPLIVMITFILIEPQRSSQLNEVYLKLRNRSGDIITIEDVKSLFSGSNQTTSGFLPAIERSKSFHSPRLFSEPKETPRCKLPPITPTVNASK